MGDDDVMFVHDLSPDAVCSKSTEALTFANSLTQGSTPYVRHFCESRNPELYRKATGFPSFNHAEAGL
jgi:hypothetical protein